MEIDSDTSSSMHSAHPAPKQAADASQTRLSHEHSTRFASLKALSPWIPAVDPEKQNQRTFDSWLNQQRTMLVLACISASLVFVVNLATTITFPALYPEARLYTGSCTTVAQLDSSLHVVINGLSTLLLGASNLCMQLPSAPTRAEVDAAHSKKRWLDIGIPSVRNLKYIAKKRTILWVLLGFTSLPLHFLWNSAIISVQPENEYFWSVVSPDFLNGQRFSLQEANRTVSTRTDWVWGLCWGNWNNRPMLVPYGTAYLSGKDDPQFNGTEFQAQLSPLQQSLVTLQQYQWENMLHITNLSRLECLNRYLSFERDASNLILVSSTDIIKEMSYENLTSGGGYDNITRGVGQSTTGNNSLLIAGFFGNNWDSVRPGLFEPWQCGISNWFQCHQPWTLTESDVEYWNVQGYQIDYCLSQTKSLKNKCSLRFELPFMIGECLGTMYCLMLSGALT